VRAVLSCGYDLCRFAKCNNVRRGATACDSDPFEIGTLGVRSQRSCLTGASDVDGVFPQYRGVGQAGGAWRGARSFDAETGVSLEEARRP
jgi:hypothetical protein